MIPTLIETITAVNARELNNRYGSTFGFLPKPDGSRLVVRVTEVRMDHTDVIDCIGNTYRLNSDTGCSLEFTQVPSGWYELWPGFGVVVARKPERQWKRGICPENTHIFAGKPSGVLTTMFWDGEIIQKLFYPDQQPPEDYSTDSWCKTKVLSKFFAIAEKNIYLKTQKIGTLENDVATLETSLVRQELSDAFRRNKMEIKIECPL